MKLTLLALLLIVVAGCDTPQNPAHTPAPSATQAKPQSQASSQLPAPVPSHTPVPSPAPVPRQPTAALPPAPSAPPKDSAGQLPAQFLANPWDYFPMDKGRSWRYRIDVASVDPLTYEVFTVRRGADRDAMRIVKSGSLTHEAGRTLYYLELRVTNRGKAGEDDRHGAELEVARDELGVFGKVTGEPRQIFWMVDTDDPHGVVHEVRFELVAAFPGDGMQSRPIFFAGQPGDSCSTTWNEKLHCQGGQDDRVSFLREVKDPQKRQDNGDPKTLFTEQRVYEKGKGMVRLEQKIDGRISMTWTLETSPSPDRAQAARPVITNSIGIRLATIEPGQFLMGTSESPESLAAASKKCGDPMPLDVFAPEYPQHLVRITKPFYLGVYPVTVGQYRRVMGVRPGEPELNPDWSVAPVPWEDAQKFCQQLSALPEEKALKRMYRLPTEAEWEYACRARTTTRWCFGNDVKQLGEYARFAVGGNFPKPPEGPKKPNAWGLYGMHGDVWEWCSDRYDDRYYWNSPLDDPPGPASGDLRVVRGASYDRPALLCRSAFRDGHLPYFIGRSSADMPPPIGFRVAMASHENPASSQEKQEPPREEVRDDGSRRDQLERVASSSEKAFGGVIFVFRQQHANAVYGADGRRKAYAAELGALLDMLGPFSGAACATAFAEVLRDEREYEAAVELQTGALANLAKLPRPQCAQAVCYKDLAQTFHDCGRLADAIDAQQSALDIEVNLGNRQEQAECQGVIASMLLLMARYEEALGRLHTALGLLAQLTDTDYINTSRRDYFQASCHMSIGGALDALGRYEEALREVKAALGIFPNLSGARDRQIECLLNMGQILLHLDRDEEALQAFQSVRSTLPRFLSDEAEQGACGVLQGEALLRLGRHDEAAAVENEVLARLAEAPRTSLSGNTEIWAASAARTVLGRALFAQGRFAEAYHELLRAEAESHALGMLVWDDSLARAAEGLAAPADLGKAVRHQWDAINSLESVRRLVCAPDYQISWFDEKAVVYENMARLLLHLQREKVPLEQKDVLQWGATPEEAALHFADRGKARTLLELIANRPVTTGDVQSAALLAQQRQLDEEINALLKQRGARAQAGQEARFAKLTADMEQKQAQQREIEGQLRRTAAGAFIEPPLLKPVEFCKTLRPEEACLEYVACEKELLIFMASAKGVKAYRVEIARDTSRAQRENGHPSLAKLVAAFRHSPDRPETLGLEGLVWLQREWMDHPRVKDRQLTEAEHVAVSRVLGHFLFPADLWQALIDGQVKHLVIVPSRVLALTSFATLVTTAKRQETVPTKVEECQFLVEGFSLSYVQSLSLLEPIRRRAKDQGRSESAGREFIALADVVHDNVDPRSNLDFRDLPVAQDEFERSGQDMVTRELMRDVSGQRLEETRQEAMTVAKGFGQPQVYEGPLSELPDGSGGSAVCVGYAANRPLAKSEGVGRCRHLLFSVHGQSDMSNPWLSSLMLTDLAAQPGRRQPAPLTMADVFGMKLSAQTVVLAACETAMGRIRSGEGVVGFQLAFLFAGAPTVVLTQWQIPSKVPMGPGKWAYPTTTVLTEFYRAMRERSVSRAEALRQGQLKVLHEQGALADPYFWGAWQLFGEWR